MKKFLALVLAAALLAGCSAPAEPKPTQEPTPTPETENKETEKKEVATSGKYVVVNTTGETITELYIYKTGSEEKGTNYADGGLADGESVTIEVQVDEAEAEGYAQTLEFVNESGKVENGFQTLHLDVVSIYLLAEGADAFSAARPFLFAH